MRTRNGKVERSQSAKATETPFQRGREVGWPISRGSKLLLHALLPHRSSLTKQKGTDKIKNSKTVLNLMRGGVSFGPVSSVTELVGY